VKLERDIVKSMDLERKRGVKGEKGREGKGREGKGGARMRITRVVHSGHYSPCCEEFYGPHD
jgi:hypothetical protein